MLRLNWIQRPEPYQQRQQNEGPPEWGARHAERWCMAVVSSCREVLVKNYVLTETRQRCSVKKNFGTKFSNTKKFQFFRCKSENERDLRFYLRPINSKVLVEHNRETAGVSQRKVQATIGLYTESEPKYYFVRIALKCTVKNQVSTATNIMFRFGQKPRICWAARGTHWLRQRAATPKGEANPLISILFESRAAIRPREGEIPSNRVLA